MEPLTTLTAALRPGMELTERITSALESPNRAGTMRAWFESHNGKPVNTLQLIVWGIDTDTPRPSFWQPGARTVDTSRATYVTLDGSRRDFAGMSVVHASPDTLIVQGVDSAVVYYA